MKKPRKYCGPKLVARISKLTEKCYESALLEAAMAQGFSGSLSELQNHIRWMKVADSATLKHTVLLEDYNITWNVIAAISRNTDDIYLEKISSLTSKEIEDILWVHEKGRLVRAPRTVERLLAELAHRSLIVPQD